MLRRYLLEKLLQNALFDKIGADPDENNHYAPRYFAHCAPEIPTLLTMKTACARMGTKIKIIFNNIYILI
jgi:hypothetical protein